MVASGALLSFPWPFRRWNWVAVFASIWTPCSELLLDRDGATASL